MADLTSLLGIGLVAESELAHLLSERFNFAEQRDDELIFYLSGADWAVRLFYDDDRLARAESGPSFREEDGEYLRNRIATDLLGPQQRSIRRVILFSGLPVLHFLRVDDILQLLPAPPGAPRPDFLMAEHPFVLEFPLLTSDVTWVTATRLLRSIDELSWLLNVLLRGTVTSSAGRAEHHWVFRPGTDLTDLRCEYLQEGYTAPGFIGQTDEFSRPEPYGAMPLVPASEYYTHRGIQAGEPLNAAADTPELISVFSLLAGEERQRFIRAAHWYRQYEYAWHRSISSAFVALICAVEALIPPQPGGPRCGACGKETGKGPTQRFIDLLEELAPSSDRDDVAARRELYRIRSKLTHGGSLLRMDLERGAFLHPATSTERKHLDHAQALTRRALVNWLCRHRADATVAA